MRDDPAEHTDKRSTFLLLDTSNRWVPTLDSDVEIRYTSEVIWARLPDGSKAWLIYRVEGDRMFLEKTYTPPQHRGKGIARKLVEKAIEIAKQRNLKIVPVCSYTIWFFARNPGKRGVLAEEFRGLSDDDWAKLFERRLSEERGSREDRR